MNCFDKIISQYDYSDRMKPGGAADVRHPVRRIEYGGAHSGVAQISACGHPGAFLRSFADQVLDAAAAYRQQ